MIISRIAVKYLNATFTNVYSLNSTYLSFLFDLRISCIFILNHFGLFFYLTRLKINSGMKRNRPISSFAV